MGQRQHGHTRAVSSSPAALFLAAGTRGASTVCSCVHRPRGSTKKHNKLAAPRIPLRVLHSPVYAESGLPASWRHMCSGSSASCKKTRDAVPRLWLPALLTVLSFFFLFLLFFVSELLLCLVTCHPAAVAPGIKQTRRAGAAPSTAHSCGQALELHPACREVQGPSAPPSPQHRSHHMSPWHGSRGV